MANPRTTKRWSTLRRIQFGVTAFGILITAAFLIFDEMQVELPKYSAVSDLVFQTGMLLIGPAWIFGQAIGFETHSSLLSAIVIIGFNTVIFFALGTIVGWLFTVCVPRKRPESLHGSPPNQ